MSAVAEQQHTVAPRSSFAAMTEQLCVQTAQKPLSFTERQDLGIKQNQANGQARRQEWIALYKSIRIANPHRNYDLVVADILAALLDNYSFIGKPGRERLPRHKTIADYLAPMERDWIRSRDNQQPFAGSSET